MHFQLDPLSPNGLSTVKVINDGVVIGVGGSSGGGAVGATGPEGPTGPVGATGPGGGGSSENDFKDLFIDLLFTDDTMTVFGFSALDTLAALGAPDGWYIWFRGQTTDPSDNGVYRMVGTTPEKLDPQPEGRGFAIYCYQEFNLDTFSLDPSFSRWVNFLGGTAVDVANWDRFKMRVEDVVGVEAALRDEDWELPVPFDIMSFLNAVSRELSGLAGRTLNPATTAYQNYLVTSGPESLNRIRYVEVDTAGQGQVLPDVISVPPGAVFHIINSSSGSVPVTSADPAQTIGNTSSDPDNVSVPAGSVLKVVNNGTVWRVL